MSREVVVDASAAAAWVLPDERRPAAMKVLEAVRGRELRIVLPELWRYEMLNVLRSAVARGRMEEAEARRSLHVIAAIPVEALPAEPTRQPAILAAAFEHGLSVYDAAYFVLAQQRGIELVSEDRDLLQLQAQFPWIYSLDEFSGQL